MRLWVSSDGSEDCIHLSVQHILILCGSSFQMLEIYSNPTLGTSCFQLDAIGKRVIQLSQVSICSTMYPHSYPDSISKISLKDQYKYRKIFILKKEGKKKKE